MQLLPTAFVICTITQLAFGQSKGPLKIGDKCKLENKKKGICKPFPECAAAVKDLAENDKWPLLCEYGDEASIVCCDESGGSAPTAPTTSTTTTTTTRRPTTVTRRPTTKPTRPVTKPTISSTKPTKRPKPNKLPVGFLSRQKCVEYSKWLPVLTSSFFEEEERIPGNCGAVLDVVIWNGDKTDPLEFPHMAHLGFTLDANDPSEKPVFSCGGSLISDQYVVTAAHCLQKKSGAGVSHVRLGSGDFRSDIIVRVNRTFKHPEYKSYYNDIALLKLQEPVKFTDHRRPACLQVNTNFKNEKADASGWGTTETGQDSLDLLKVTLPIVSYAECSETFPRSPFTIPRGIDDRIMFCAGTTDKKQDTCQGDSGGPLQIVLKEPSCMYSVIGITSFGYKCGLAPGVYTRVSAYISWIEAIVWGQN